MNWYRVSTENVRWRQPDATSSLRKRGGALVWWVAVVILVLTALLSLAADRAQPLILLACVGAGMLVGDQVTQFAHELLGVLTDRWRERPPSAYCRRHAANPRIRLKGTVLGGILAVALWYAFHPSPANWLSADDFVIAIAKAQAVLSGRPAS